MINAGVVNIYKEKGYTSHDVVAIVRRMLGQAASKRCKVGHTGTLDPQAEGVLPICIEKATRLAQYLSEDGKSYIAEVRLGLTTDTGDRTGRVLTTAPVFFDEDAIASAAARFVGEYEQTPPMYSAVKVNGKKLYELARKGVEVERKTRTVQIRRLVVTGYDRRLNTFTMEVDCSKGTYIRTLCTDIGEALGCGACMGELVRTRSGVFTVAASVRLADFKQAVEEDRADAFIWPPERVLPYPRVYVRAEYVERAVNGNLIPLTGLADRSDKRLPVLSPGDRRWLYDGERLIGLFTVAYAASGLGMMKPEVMML